MKDIPGTTHITRHGKNYEGKIKLNGKEHNLFHATTLIIALVKLDWCKAHNWEKYPYTPSYITRTPCGHYIVKKSYRRNGKIITDFFGTFKTLEEAEHEVTLLKKYDWDIDALCDCEGGSETKINVISQTTEEQNQELAEVFNEVKPLLEQGYSYNRAVKRVKRMTRHNNFAHLGWYKSLIKYGESQGYLHRDYMRCKHNNMEF